MATIILYATKYGATEQIAKRISKLLDDAPYHNLNDTNLPTLEDFDTIILGTSVYAGSTRKEAKQFLSKHKKILVEKNISFFLSGLSQSKDDPDTFYKKNFPADLLNKAQATAFLGGIFDPEKTTAAERMIIKLVAQQTTFINTINERKIKEFVAAVQQ